MLRCAYPGAGRDLPHRRALQLNPRVDSLVAQAARAERGQSGGWPSDQLQVPRLLVQRGWRRAWLLHPWSPPPPTRPPPPPPCAPLSIAPHTRKLLPAHSAHPLCRYLRLPHNHPAPPRALTPAAESEFLPAAESHGVHSESFWKVIEEVPLEEDGSADEPEKVVRKPATLFSSSDGSAVTREVARPDAGEGHALIGK